jgi:type 1 fimbria pilin
MIFPDNHQVRARRVFIANMLTICCSLGIPVGVEANQTTFSLQISGSVLPVSCDIGTSSKSINVDLGNISAGIFKAVGATSPPKDFSIALTGCSTNVEGGVIQFTGIANGSDRTLLALNQDSTADNVGIEIIDGQTGSALPLGAVSSTYTLQAGDNTLHYKLRYRATQVPVVSGTANAVMFFDLGYQ